MGEYRETSEIQPSGGGLSLNKSCSVVGERRDRFNVNGRGVIQRREAGGGDVASNVTCGGEFGASPKSLSGAIIAAARGGACGCGASWGAWLGAPAARGASAPQARPRGRPEGATPRGAAGARRRRARAGTCPTRRRRSAAASPLRRRTRSSPPPPRFTRTERKSGT